MKFYIVSILLAISFMGMFQLLSKRLPNDKVLTLSTIAKSLVLLLSLLSLFILSGFRVDVGIDYPGYVRWFNDIYLYNYTHIEPGFILLVKTIQLFTLDSQWLFITMSLLTLGVLYYSIIKSSANPVLSIFLFCCMGFLSHSLNLSRQFIAVVFILYAYRHIVNGSFLKYISSILAASLFHQTALMFLVMYHALRVKLHARSYILLSTICAVVALFNSPFKSLLVNVFYPQYSNEDFVSDTIVSPYYIMISLGLMFFVIYLVKLGRLDIEDMKDRLVVNIVFLVTMLHTFLSWIPLSNRISLYVDISLIIIIPYLISLIPEKGRRHFIIIAVVIYFSLFAYLSFSNNSNGVLPYRSSLLHVVDESQSEHE